MDFIRFTWHAYHPDKDSIEVRTAARIESDNHKIQKEILDQIRSISPQQAMNSAANTYLHEDCKPKFEIKKDDSEEGWEKMLGRLKSHFEPPRPNEIRICAIHVIVDPDLGNPDNDLIFTIKTELNASRLIGTLFHRRICTIDP